MRIPLYLVPSLRHVGALVIGAGLLLTGCSDGDDGAQGAQGPQGEQGPQGPQGDPGADGEDLTRTTAFTLQLLHVADGEAGLEATADLPRFSAVLNALRGEMPGQTLTLSAGDNYIPGVFMNAGADPAMADVLDAAGQGNQGRSNGQGRADIAVMNLMGFQASALGNHEFDLNTGLVEDLVGGEFREAGPRWIGAQFPYLSANLDLTTDGNLAGLVVDDQQTVRDADELKNSLAKSFVIWVDSNRVGIIGATTPLLDSISSSGDVTVMPDDAMDYATLASHIQYEADMLTAQGVDKIILLSHMQQYGIEMDELAPRLEHVDVVVAGGSNALFADENDVLRADETQTIAEGYPVWRESRVSGAPIAVVNTPGNWRYLGRLMLNFDANGQIILEEHDSTVNGVYATDDAGVARLGTAAVENTDVRAIADAIRDVVASKDGNVFGSTDVFLNGERASVRTQQTNLGDLTAVANRWWANQQKAAEAPTVLISHKNGGGIRASIGDFTSGDNPQPVPPIGNEFKEDGEISQLAIENSMRFNNGLVMVTVTAEQLLELVEHAVAATGEGATPGQFGQWAGVRFEYDASLPAGSRVYNLDVDVSFDTINVTDTIVADGVLQGDATRTFRMVTLNFIEGGGDSYPFPAFAAEDAVRYNRVALDDNDVSGFEDPSGEQWALAQYLAEFHDTDNGGSAFDEEDEPDAAMDTNIIPITIPASVSATN
jgi:2',3'-cyclic-nucleotide 2'-phosphodiesterase (5'-nucleotidase family)